MAPEKEQVTEMILNVDLKCSCCYKKVRKVLCKFPQIRDQVFDEEKNKVMITVACCDPEKMRDKICSKGGKAIQSIEIVEKPKPEPQKLKPKAEPEKPNKPKAQPEQLDKKPSGKPQSNANPPPMPKPDPPKMDPPKPDPPKKPDPVPVPQPVKMPDPIPQPQPQPAKMPDPIPQPQSQPEPVKMHDPIPMDGHPHPFCPPVSVCCQECYEGRGGGPCHYGYGRPVPPPPGPCYEGYGYGYGYQYAGNRPPCYASRCDYFSEENPQGCSIM